MPPPPEQSGYVHIRQYIEVGEDYDRELELKILKERERERCKVNFLQKHCQGLNRVLPVHALSLALINYAIDVTTKKVMTQIASDKAC